MKKVLTVLSLCIALTATQAQTTNPVKWAFKSVKKSPGTYAVYCTAGLTAPWHIYSQFTPQGGPLPTKFTFNPNPLLAVSGPVVESGQQTTIHDKNFGVDVTYFTSSVSFVQLVKVKADVKTNLHGTIEYMTCNDNKCLPPVKIPFDIVLQ